MPGLLLNEDAPPTARSCAPLARGPSGMFTRSTPRMRSCRACSTSASARWPRGGTSSTLTTKLPRASALRHPRLLAPAAPAARRRRRRRRAADGRRRRPRRRRGAERAHRRLDLPDVLRRRPAAAADQPHAAVDEPPRVRRHVLGRAEVDVAPFDLARPAGVGLRRELDACATRAIRSIVSSIAAGPTLQFRPTTSAPQLLELAARTSRAPRRRACCRPPRSSSARRSGASHTLRTARIAAPISLTSRKVSSTKRSTPPSSERRAPARAKYASASSTPVLPQGSMRMPSGPIAPAT